MSPQTMLLAKAYYFLSAGSGVFLLPYIYPFLIARGHKVAELGVISALRPWLAATGGLVLPALADRLQCHRLLMLSTFGAAIVLRLSMFYVTNNFFALLLVVLLAEFLAAPVSVLGDAMVVAASEKAGGYGRQRLWASIGGGGLSYPAGLLLDKCGFGAGFFVYGVLSVPWSAVLMRFTYSSSVAAASGVSGGERATGAIAPSANGCSTFSARQEEKSPFRGADSLLTSSQPVVRAASTPSPFLALDIRDCETRQSSEATDGFSSCGYTAVQHGRSFRRINTCSHLTTRADVGRGPVEDENHAHACTSTHLANSPPSSCAQMSDASCTDSHGVQWKQKMQEEGVEASTGRIAGSCCGEDAEKHGRQRLLPTALAASAELFSKMDTKPVPQHPRTESTQRGPVFHVSRVECGDRAVAVEIRSTTVAGPPSLRPTAAAVSVRRRTGLPAAPRRRSPALQPLSSPEMVAEQLPASFVRGALQLMSSTDVWLFLAHAFIMGFGLGAIWTWLLVYVGALGAPHALQGLMLTFNCIAEVPVFHYQEAITARFPINSIMNISIGSLVLRLAAYAALPSLPGVPWVVLPVELLQGVTFALYWGAACVQCKRIAPSGLQATMQGLMQSAFGGVGCGLGGLMGAILHERLGGRVMFLRTGAAVATGWLVLETVELLLPMLLAARRRRGGCLNCARP